MANSRKPTFDINDPEFQKILAEMVAKTMAAEKEAAQAAVKTEKTTGIDAKVLKAFKAKGYKDLVLFDRTKTLAEQGSTVTVLTFGKWMDLGRRPKEGEHSLKIPGYFVRLFHKSQTRIATIEERKADFAKRQAAVAKREKSEQATA